MRVKHAGQWYTDGHTNLFRVNCPEGFQPGRVIKDQSEYRHYTNGIENKFCKDCPEGFWPGLTTHVERKPAHRNGVKHYTDGCKNVFAYDCPEGFHPGMTMHNPVTARTPVKLNQLVANINRNEFISFYLVNSDQRCADKFNTSKHLIRKLAQHFGIIRSDEQFKNIKKQIRADKRSKTEATCLAKYGVTNVNKSQEVQERNKKKLQDKYGIAKGGRAIFALNSNATDEFKKLLFNREASVNFFILHNHEYNKDDLKKLFNCSQFSLDNWIYKFDLAKYVKTSLSHYEDEICQLFNTVNFIRRDRKVLDGRELDLYSPETHVAIEFNGTYWHSAAAVPKNYHLDKSKLASSKSIRIIHIYEHEWNNPDMRSKIIQLCKIALNQVESKIYARKCEIREITNKEARPFNEANHLQGHRNAQVTYGLFYNGELVQLMSFSKTKYNRNLKGDNDWEIIRGCPGSNNIVVGGVSKLFKHFIREHNPDSVFSYCDFNKFDGRGYEAIGMKFVGYTGPDMYWITKDWQVMRRNPSKHSEMQQNAVTQLYGAGSKKYLWRKSE